MGENELHEQDELVPKEEKTDLGELKQAAGKAALATVLAGSITSGAAAITPDSVVLPEATPLVQTLDYGSGADLPDSVVDDDQATKTSVWKKILQILKFVVVALLLVASVVFGVLKGCASCSGSLVAPIASSSSGQQDAHEEGQQSSQEA